MPTYKRTPAPASPVKGFLDTELQRVQRAVHGLTARTLTGDFEPLGSDDLLLIDTTAGAVIVTLPLPSIAKDARWTFKNVAANLVTIVGLIDGVNPRTLPNQYDALTIQSDGAAYYIIAQVP